MKPRGLYTIGAVKTTPDRNRLGSPPPGARRVGLTAARRSDGQKIIGLEARATDQRTVDVGSGEQFRGIVGLDGTAVQNADTIRLIVKALP